MTIKSSRDEARAAGQIKFFTGRACPHGHVTERLVSSYQCVACLADRNSTKVHKDYKNALAKKRRGDPERWIGQAIAYARRRALATGLEFEIEAHDVYLPEICPVLGVKLILGGGRNSDCAPSLDRVDNTKGYVRGNVRVISSRANVIKRDATLPEIEAIASYMREHGEVARSKVNAAMFQEAA